MTYMIFLILKYQRLILPKKKWRLALKCWYFRDFVGDEDMTELPLPKSTLTTGEVQCIKDIAKEFELEVVEIGVVSTLLFTLL